VFHGVTWSWEPGLRSADNARAILAAIESPRARLAADTKFHLRHETYNLAAEDEVCDWIAARRIGALAFNDHLPSPDSVAARPGKLAQMVARSGVPHEDFVALVEQLRGRDNEVPGSIERIAAHANTHGIALLSHDDASPEQRRWYRALGCRVSEFPMTVETAREAARSGDQIVLGAPNVMRGKSHVGWTDATKMVGDGLCSVLASDYYYPAPLIAAAVALSVDATDCVYVGDAERDIAAGQAAGMKTLVASYGYLGADDSPERWPADGWIESLPALLEWLPHEVSPGTLPR